MRFAILSDYPIIRNGFGSFIRRIHGRVTVEAYASECTPLDLSGNSCDLALIDVGTTPIQASLAAIREISTNAESPPVVGFECTTPWPEQLKPFARAGMVAYVLIAPDMVTEGGMPADDSTEGRVPPPASLLEQDRRSLVLSGSGTLRGISESDLSILRLIAEGLRYDDIATRLNCGESTVKHHVEEIRKRYHLGTPAELGVWLHANSLGSLLPDAIREERGEP